MTQETTGREAVITQSTRTPPPVEERLSGGSN